MYVLTTGDRNLHSSNDEKSDAKSAFLRSIIFMVCRALFSWLRTFAQRIIDWRISKHRRDDHSDEAGYQHRQQHCEAGRHLHNEYDAGYWGANDAGEEGGHPDNGEAFWWQAETVEDKMTQRSKEQTELSSQHEHGRKEAA